MRSFSGTMGEDLGFEGVVGGDLGSEGAVWSHDPTVEHSLFPGCSHPLIFLLMIDANETQSMIVDCHG